MLKLLSGLSIICGLLLIFFVIKLRPLVTGLTIHNSWKWAVGASTSVLVATVLTSGYVQVDPGWKSAGQMVAVVMLLTPAVSTLGARQPGALVWQCFVVAPMILVLLWPGASQLISSHGRESLTLGIPAMTGIFLVLIMSAGTCIGTAMTMPALLHLLSLFCAVLPSTGWLTADSCLPLFAAPLLLTGALLGGKVVSRRYAAIDQATALSDAVEHTWLLFQDLYGLVWARRVEDRVNQFAKREKWGVLLTLEGFRHESGRSATAEELQKPRDAFRWVLGRFADEAWIRSRLFRLG